MGPPLLKPCQRQMEIEAIEAFVRAGRVTICPPPGSGDMRRTTIESIEEAQQHAARVGATIVPTYIKGRLYYRVTNAHGSKPLAPPAAVLWVQAAVQRHEAGLAQVPPSTIRGGKAFTQKRKARR